MIVRTKPLGRICFLLSFHTSILCLLWAPPVCDSFSASSVGCNGNKMQLPIMQGNNVNTNNNNKMYYWGSVVNQHIAQQRLRCVQSFLAAAKIGIFYGTSTGGTLDVAHLIAAEFGPEIADEPVDVEEIKGSLADTFASYASLVVGTPTWNTGAETERSGTAWDELYYKEMQALKLGGKNVAVFGLGDSSSYADNYGDASGELHDTFQKLEGNMMGYTSQEGYEHSASKAIRGDLFCGLLCDQVNQEELTEGRVKKWVKQLLEEGILKEGAAAPASTSVSASLPVDTSVTSIATTTTATTTVSTNTNSAVVNSVAATTLEERIKMGSNLKSANAPNPPNSAVINSVATVTLEERIKMGANLKFTASSSTPLSGGGTFPLYNARNAKVIEYAGNDRWGEEEITKLKNLRPTLGSETKAAVNLISNHKRVNIGATLLSA